MIYRMIYNLWQSLTHFPNHLMTKDPSTLKFTSWKFRKLPSFQCYVSCICCCYVLYVFNWLGSHIIGLHGNYVPYFWNFFNHPWFKSQVSRPSRFAQLQLWSSCSLFSSYGSIHSWRHHNSDIFYFLWHIFWYFRAFWAFYRFMKVLHQIGRKIHGFIHDMAATHNADFVESFDVIWERVCWDIFSMADYAIRS